MHKLSQVLRVILFFCLLAFGACVTINIYFPAEKVESVAGEIVNDIRGERTEEEPDAEDNDQSYVTSPTLLASLLPDAVAQDATTVSNPTIRALKNSMKNRYAQLKAWYQKNLLVEGDDGFLAATNLNSIGIKERRTVQSLIEAENKDRRKLYLEVARSLNIDPSQVDRVGQIFAKEWQMSQGR